jgi:hypothetical protein
MIQYLLAAQFSIDDSAYWMPAFAGMAKLNRL